MSAILSNIFRINVVLIPLMVLLVWAIPFSVQAAGASAEPTSVYDAIQGGKQVTSDPKEENPALKDVSLVPFFFKMIFSLALIILLIYLFLKFLATKTRQIQSQGPFQLLGGCTLGANRSVQVIQIGQTIYILGVGEDVQLIRSISPGEEYDDIMGKIDVSVKSTPSIDLSKWFKKEEPSTDNWDRIFQTQLQELKLNQESSLDQWPTHDQEDKQK